jgi:hypothetical protein
MLGKSAHFQVEYLWTSGAECILYQFSASNLQETLGLRVYIVMFPYVDCSSGHYILDTVLVYSLPSLSIEDKRLS